MSLYQRGNVWYYLFYLNGKRYRGSTKTENEREAERLFAKARVAAEAGESLRPRRAPFVRDFAKEFLEWVDATMLAEKTKDDYRNGCRLILNSTLRGKRLDEITKDDIETAKFHESEASRDCGMRTIRRMLGKAQDRKLIREVPRVRRPRLAGRDRMVTDADEQVLLPDCPRPLQDVLTIMLDSGMRPGEIVRMCWEFINWAGAFYFNRKGKTRKARRHVPLSERVIRLLRAIQQEKSGVKQGWVFPSKKSRSGHIELSGLEHMFRKVARKLGLPEELKPYCARHTFGTVAMAETRDPGLVKEVMGHESLVTTMKYLHPVTTSIKAVIDRRNRRNRQNQRKARATRARSLTVAAGQGRTKVRIGTATKTATVIPITAAEQVVNA